MILAVISTGDNNPRGSKGLAIVDKTMRLVIFSVLMTCEENKKLSTELDITLNSAS